MGRFLYTKRRTRRTDCFGNNTPMRTLGELLRESRVAAGISLRTLASEMEITPSYMSDIENDRRVPSEDVLRKISHRLGVDLNQAMAMAGRFGEQAERYLKEQPAAVALFRKISERNLSKEELEEISMTLDKPEK